MEKEIILSHLKPALAAQLLAGMDRLDPRGLATPADLLPMTHEGQCFAATADGAQCVYVIKVRNGVAWIDAMKGNGPAPWVRLLGPVIDLQAKGCRAVGFQTARRGMVRQAEGLGYHVTGWIMQKELQC